MIAHVIINARPLMSTKISIAEAINSATQTLTHAGVPEARRESGSLLAHILGKDRTFLISHAEDGLNAQDLELLLDYVERRAKGEPFQYITGQQEFYGRKFEVTPDVLIPRPETELLVETVLKLSTQASLICDVGTGSGCIAITLLKELPSASAIALDISGLALRVAKRNAIRHGVTERLHLVQGDCLSAVREEKQFLTIVSNPPYVAAGALAGLQREVRDHEPVASLTAGQDGLDVIRRLFVEAGPRLVSGGFLVFEFGFDQGAAVERLAAGSGLSLVDIQNDYQGIPRIAALQKP